MDYACIHFEAINIRFDEFLIVTISTKSRFRGSINPKLAKTKTFTWRNHRSVSETISFSLWPHLIHLLWVSPIFIRFLLIQLIQNASSRGKLKQNLHKSRIFGLEIRNAIERCYHLPNKRTNWNHFHFIFEPIFSKQDVSVGAKVSYQGWTGLWLADIKSN